jgi:[acyl-carrier-protein] S-malonyltransferase
MSTAVLFPGQGSHAPGMRELVAAEAPELLDRATALVGDDPFPRVTEDTRFAQPAIFCASVAGWRRVRQEVGTPAAVAGHSLGELAALVAADALDAQEALELVVLRGRLMGEAPAGGMLALLGASDDRAEELALAHGVAVANYNAPGQVVVSGTHAALERVAAAAREEGVRALDLGVAGAFHSPAMAGTVAPFAAALERARFRAPRMPVVSALTAAPMDDPRRLLARALVEPVRWTATVRALAAMGILRFVDAGPGGVLERLVRRALPGPVHA